MHDVCPKQFCTKHMSDFVYHFLYRGRKNKHAGVSPALFLKIVHISFPVRCSLKLREGDFQEYETTHSTKARAITIIQTHTGKRFLSYTVCPISRVPSQPVRSSQLSATTITFEYHPLERKVRIVFSCTRNYWRLTPNRVLPFFLTILAHSASNFLFSHD